MAPTCSTKRTTCTTTRRPSRSMPQERPDVHATMGFAVMRRASGGGGRLVASAATAATPVERTSAGWRFLSRGGANDRAKAPTDWQPAGVPGAVQTDLLALGRIGDPFWHNEAGLQWIGLADWDYQLSRVRAALAASRRSRFTASTPAEVGLWQRSCSPRTYVPSLAPAGEKKLHPGNNTLLVHFSHHRPSAVASQTPMRCRVNSWKIAWRRAERPSRPLTTSQGPHHWRDWGPHYRCRHLAPRALGKLGRLGLTDLSPRRRWMKPTRMWRSSICRPQRPPSQGCGSDRAERHARRAETRRADGG